MILARKKMDARRALGQKLSVVTAQLKALQVAAKNVSGEAVNLTKLKSNLSKSIGTIERQIGVMRSQDQARAP